MLLKRFFIEQGKKEINIENYIKEQLKEDVFSKIELERTPLGIKVNIYTDRPGRIIGSRGAKINEITEKLKKKFNLENPQLDAKLIENPFLDADTVARRIAEAIERNVNYKRIGNVMVKRVMDAGAVGVEIKISGKLGGSEKKSTAKFSDGYVKHCGEPSKTLVDTAFREALTKPGKIGIRVKIMKEFPHVVRLKDKNDKKGVDDGNNEEEGDEKAKQA